MADVGRQQWHEYKMQSKLQRAQEQLQLLSLVVVPPPVENGNSSTASPLSSTLPGVVYHY
jgi:hypothetical protein